MLLSPAQPYQDTSVVVVVVVTSRDKGLPRHMDRTQGVESWSEPGRDVSSIINVVVSDIE